MFTIQPRNIVLLSATTRSLEFATFTCQHDTADIVSWLVNQTTLSYLDANITTSLQPLPNAAPLHKLNIPARQQYNMTQVICLAIFFDGREQERSDPPSYLIFQGNLVKLIITCILVYICSLYCYT